VSSEAELAFREGTYHFDRYHQGERPADFEGALAAFTRALALDPSLAAAAGKVAELFATRIIWEGDVHDLRKQAESWARRALGIDPRCGKAWAALGSVELNATQADPERGIDYAVKAVAFTPRDAFAHLALGMWLGDPGSQSLFVAASRRALELAPILLSAAGNTALGLCWLGRPAEALPMIDRALQVEPDWPFGLVGKGFALTKLGRLDEAESTLRRCEQAANADRTDREFWRQFRFALAVAQRDSTTSEALARQIFSSVFDSRADANFLSVVVLNVVPALAHRKDQRRDADPGKKRRGRRPACVRLAARRSGPAAPAGRPSLRQGARSIPRRRGHGRPRSRSGAHARRAAVLPQPAARRGGQAAEAERSDHLMPRRRPRS